MRLCFLTFGLLLIGCSGKHEPVSIQTSNKPSVFASRLSEEDVQEDLGVSATCTRLEFEKGVIGKNEQEVTLALGVPATTKEKNKWVYRKLTRESNNAAMDRSTIIYWKDGLVEHVEYIK